jgi:hypothetical protein
MSPKQSEEIHRERICFLVKDRVVIGERLVPQSHAGVPPRIVYTCTRSAECAQLNLPCKILNQELPQYPFDLKVSLKLKPAEPLAPVPWKRQIKAL